MNLMNDNSIIINKNEKNNKNNDKSMLFSQSTPILSTNYNNSVNNSMNNSINNQNLMSQSMNNPNFMNNSINNQSINQSIDKSINKSIDYALNYSTKLRNKINSKILPNIKTKKELNTNNNYKRDPVVFTKTNAKHEEEILKQSLDTFQKKGYAVG